MRRRLSLLLAACLPVALTAVLMASCSVFGSDPNDAAAAFLAAVSRGDNGAAGVLTDDPVASTALLGQVRDELKPQRVQLTLGQTRSGDKTASASFSAVWDLGQGRQWTYPGGFDLVPADTAEGWLVRWSPAALHPRLAAQQRVLLREVPAEPVAVVDRAGTPLLTMQTVVTVALDRSKTSDLPGVATRLADALARIDPEITEQSIIAGANAAPPGQRGAVAVLREQDYESVRDQIYELPGVTFSTQQGCSDRTGTSPLSWFRASARRSKNSSRQPLGGASSR